MLRLHSSAAALATALVVTVTTVSALAGDPMIAPAQQAASQPSTAPSAPPAPSVDPGAPPAAQPTVPPVGQAPSGQPTAPPPPPPNGIVTYPVHPWEMEPVDVTVPGQRTGLREEQLIGAYKQPRWTAKRRFPTTRVYVVPAGKMEFEWWFRYTAPFESPRKERELRSLWEFEMGLGHHLQLDIYLVGQQIGENQFQLTREKAEIRWALADWDVIPGNPTLYLEYQHQSGPASGSGTSTEPKPDTLEGKLLFGGEATSRVHWGLNLQWERELWGSEADEFQLTGGLSYTVKDEELHVGIEGYGELVDEKGSYGDFKEQSYLFGPSIMWSPVRPANILLVPLFGAGVEDGKVRGVFQTYLITGWTY